MAVAVAVAAVVVVVVARGTTVVAALHTSSPPSKRVYRGNSVKLWHLILASKASNLE